jgi:hypothetical protein
VVAPSTAEPEPSARQFVVGFAGGPSEQWLALNAPGLAKQQCFDYAGRPVLSVWDLGNGGDLLPRLAAELKARPPKND